MPATTAIVAESREILTKHAKSFRWAATFLPADRRDDAAIVYAFCRTADDAVDEAVDPDRARSELSALAAGLEGEGAPIAEALATVAQRRRMPLYAARQLLEGLASDLGPVCMADDAALLRYCYHAAGTVGLLMSPLLGVVEPRAHPHAIDLGIAMQLTNICRDVAEDAARGRVYLPRTRLEALGTSPEAILEGRADPRAVALVVIDLVALAERYYRSAEEGLAFIPARTRLAIVVASRIYRAIGQELLRRRGDALAGRAVVPAAIKTFWVMAAFLSWLAGAILSRQRDHRRELHRHLEGLIPHGMD